MCVYLTCEERTHPRSTVGFGFNFGLVFLKTPGIDPLMMEVDCVRSLLRKDDWPALWMQKTRAKSPSTSKQLPQIFLHSVLGKSDLRYLNGGPLFVRSLHSGVRVYVCVLYKQRMDFVHVLYALSTLTNRMCK